MQCSFQGPGPQKVHDQKVLYMVIIFKSRFGFPMMRIAHGLLTVCYVPFRVPNVPFEVPNVPFRVLGMFAHGLLTLCSR